MTNPQIIQGLIERDERITREFFFLRCQPLVYSLIQKFFGGDADYDELVNVTSWMPGRTPNTIAY